MKVLNPADIFGLKEVSINVEKEEEKEKIRVGLEFIASISLNNTVERHSFRIVKITNPKKREGEIFHLGHSLKRIKFTLEMIEATEVLLSTLNELRPGQIIQACPRCHLEIIPENFLELIACPLCGKPYNLPL